MAVDFQQAPELALASRFEESLIFVEALDLQHMPGLASLSRFEEFLVSSQAAEGGWELFGAWTDELAEEKTVQVLLGSLCGKTAVKPGQVVVSRPHVFGAARLAID